jgi:hypothetical protein
MDFNRYCKRCGRKAEEIDSINGERAYKCECQEEPLKWNEVIPGFTRDARVNQLRAMHQLMIEANDENIYMTWICHVPDCPSEEDFEDIAMDNEEYNECFDLFVRLIAKKGNRY